MKGAAFCPSTAAWYRWDLPIPVYQTAYLLAVIIAQIFPGRNPFFSIRQNLRLTRNRNGAILTMETEYALSAFEVVTA